MSVELTNNYDQFRIEQNNLDKSVYNKDVSFLMSKHYYYLHKLLVTKDEYEDIFQDTYLKLTYKYDPEREFVEQFEYHFNLLKGWYYRSGKVMNYHITELNDNIDLEEEETDYTINNNYEELKNAVLSKSR